MKTFKTLTALLIGLLCALSPMAYGHNGATNEDGCHHDGSSYHCHEPHPDEDKYDKWEKIALWGFGGILAIVFIVHLTSDDSDSARFAEEHNINSIRPEFRLTDQDAMGGLSWSHGALSANGLTDGDKLEGTIQLEFPISQ